MTSTQTQTVLVPNPSNEPVVEGMLPLTLLENTSLNSRDDVTLPVRASRLQKVTVVLMIAGITVTSSMVNGLVVVALPAITKDLSLPPSLALWPASASALATASTLLLAGSVADVLGPRWVDLAGCFASGALLIGSGLVQKGTELVALRALQGVALSLHLASSVAIVTQVLPQGRSRNVAFSVLGLSQPLGFSLGLVLGGILVDTIGWRAGWYLAGGGTLIFSVIGLWALPKSRTPRRLEDIMRDFKTKVDWVGAGLASAFMAMLCYLLA